MNRIFTLAFCSLLVLAVACSKKTDQTQAVDSTKVMTDSIGGGGGGGGLLQGTNNGQPMTITLNPNVPQSVVNFTQVSLATPTSAQQVTIAPVSADGKGGINAEIPTAQLTAATTYNLTNPTGTGIIVVLQPNQTTHDTVPVR